MSSKESNNQKQPPKKFVRFDRLMHRPFDKLDALLKEKEDKSK